MLGFTFFGCEVESNPFSEIRSITISSSRGRDFETIRRRVAKKRHVGGSTLRTRGFDLPVVRSCACFIAKHLKLLSYVKLEHQFDWSDDDTRKDKECIEI